MNSLVSNIKKIGFLPIVFFIALASVGVFHEFVSCLLTVVLAIGLLCKIIRDKQIGVYINITTASVIIITAFFALSIIWAVDSGTAFIGFLKYIPILFFYILLMDRPEAKKKILTLLPVFAALMTVLSAILMQFKELEEYFAVAGRLSGFFQYPNTFALFLLVAELLLISKEKFKAYHYIILAILLGGILYSGSRTVFILAVISNIAAAFFTKNKLIKIAIFSTIGIVAVVVGVTAILGGNDILGRFLNISFKESTFVGRILYFYDALPVILKHPFGLGYRGYYYIQQEIQSGVYSVASVHNDFLQMMLDIGWLPSVIFMVALLKPIFSKNTNAITKIIILVMFLHSCFDFNLQFIAVFCMYLLFTDFTCGKYHKLSKNLSCLCGASVALAIVSLYMAVPLTLTNFGLCKTASRWYPYNTQNETYLLAEITDTDIAVAKADEILQRNPYVTLGYSVKARYYYTQGDFGSLINTKKIIFEKFPFQYFEYEEYCYMLINGITLYEQMGDTDSAEYCKKELLSIPKELSSKTERLSRLGQLIKDQPVTELPDEITDFIAQLEEENA